MNGQTVKRVVVAGGVLASPSPRVQSLIPGGARTSAAAALEFVLANPDVSCACSGMNTLEMIEEIRRLGLKQAIVSSSKNAWLVLERLQIGEIFDAVIDGNSSARSKPHPDLFLLAAQAVGVNPPNCLVVEDAQAGVEAAHAAGMKALGLGPRERVGAAELVFPSLESHSASEVIAFFEGL